MRLNESMNIFSLFPNLADYRVPNMPVNGWWHEWTFNYDVKVENNDVHLDIAEREAKILVWLGEDWHQPEPEPVAEAEKSTEQEQKTAQTESSTTSNTDSTPAEASPQQ